MTAANEITKYLDAMFADLGVVEVRAIGDVTYLGYFDDREAFCKSVKWANSQARFSGVYHALNPRRAILADNRLNLARRGRGTQDSDIAFFSRLVFDFDPARETGTNSSDDELALAREKAEFMREWLRGKDWPEPLFAMSGNGYHLQYRVKFANRPEAREALDVLYRGLKLRLDTPEVQFDTKVRNPSRIFKIYGTTAKKGESTTERPQRRSWCEVPDDWQVVPIRTIAVLAAEMQSLLKAQAPKAPAQRQNDPISGDGDYRTLDVVSWFRAHGMYKRHLFGTKHAVVCPWNAEHSTPDSMKDTSTVVWEPNGSWPNFHCSHEHCDGRSIRDVMNLLGDADSFCAKEFTYG